MKYSKRHIVFLLMLTLIVLSCTEEYNLKTENFESLLVVEATITDEFTFQEIRLSKTYRLESDEPNLVSNAQVRVETSNGIQYNFSQTEPGLYTSVVAFNAQPNESYTLNVTLTDGTSYISTPEFLPPTSDLESLETIVTNVNGDLGIQVVANSSNNSNGATYFKYDYEETYKIVAPYYSPVIVNLINVSYTPDGPIYDTETVLRTENVQTCYTTKKLTDILQTSLSDSQNNSIVDFPVRFIKNDDPIILERYSILVTQYVQSVEAYNFYKTLKELGTIENIFTDNQPGFIQGNVSSPSDVRKNIVGFFQVASVSSKRIYFNYADFDIPEPPYFYECDVTAYLNYYQNTNPNEYLQIFNYLVGGFYLQYDGQFPTFQLVTAACGDCTRFSSTLRPEFWED